MRTEDLNYDLPEELIAQEPAQRRAESRLLVLGRADGNTEDRRFDEIGRYLRAGDCLVVNDTKVIAARFFGRRLTGAKLEGLFLSEQEDGRWEVMLKGAGKVKTGEKIVLAGRGQEIGAVLVEKLGEGKVLLDLEEAGSAEEILERIGYPPLPPYIKRGREDERSEEDRQRYQTVYAKTAGAVAAPTAGLHFTDELLEELKAKGVRTAFVTLHVGAGTFKPVTAERLDQHEIHQEWYSVDQANADIINETKAAGGRIVAVGTTSVRTLESAAEQGKVVPGSGLTRLFIMPGFEFQVVDGLITNFHLPKSTLIALVGAFAGLENVKNAYRHAVEQRYRFYSYGDAMLII